MIKILILLPFAPLDKASGGNQAAINMMEYLRSKCAVTLVFPCRRHEVKALEKLKAKWADVDIRPYKYWEYKPKVNYYMSDRRYVLVQKIIGWGKKMSMHILRKSGKVATDPVHVIRDNSMLIRDTGIDYAVPPLFRFVCDIVREGYDMVQSEFWENAKLVYYLPDNVRKIFVHHELRYVRLANELSLFPDMRLEDEALYRFNKDSEIAALNRYDDIIVLTEEDRKELAQYISEPKIHCSPASIPQSKSFSFKESGAEFVFVGAGSHFPNVDGVLWLVKSVIPELRRLRSDFRIHVVGRWNKNFAKTVARECPEMKFVGFVDDLGRFLNGKISIVPIRIGSGMRMKILDSVNACSPFITTRKGVEGQIFRNMQECIICDAPEEFAAAMSELADNTVLQKKLADNASALLRKEYNPDDMLARRLAVYDDIFRKLGK